MRNKVYGRRLSRSRSARKALFRSQVRALVLNGKISTTKAKAKALQPEIDKIMNLVSKGDHLAKRAVLSRLGNDRETMDDLFGKYKDLAKSRKSGFSRISKHPLRKGDRAETVSLEFVQTKNEKDKSTKDK